MPSKHFIRPRILAGHWTVKIGKFRLMVRANWKICAENNKLVQIVELYIMLFTQYDWRHSLPTISIVHGSVLVQAQRVLLNYLLNISECGVHILKLEDSTSRFSFAKIWSWLMEKFVFLSCPRICFECRSSSLRSWSKQTSRRWIELKCSSSKVQWRQNNWSSDKHKVHQTIQQSCASAVLLKADFSGPESCLTSDGEENACNCQ